MKPDVGVVTIKGPAVQVFTGGLVDLLYPTSDMIDIRDIAAATSKLCRYTGHVKEFFSVAQHMVWCSYHVPEKFALEALLHDASEAYTGDVNRPLKQLMEGLKPKLFKGIEHALEKAVAEKYGAVWPWPPEVKRADNLALATEKRDLMPRSRAGERWPDLPRPHPEHIRPWSPQQAQHEYLVRFENLTGSEIDL